MQKENSHFMKAGSHAKFSTGPRAFRPGPTLLRHVKTPVKAVNKSIPNAVVIKEADAKMSM